MKTNLTIEFPSQEAATEFANWLCEQGEQNYWDWMDNCDESKKNTVNFIYFWPQDDEDAVFFNNNTILTTPYK